MAQSQPYTGIRILDFTHWCGSYAGRLFADLGAEVVRVEPPGGLPDRQRGDANSAQFAFVNATKKSIVLDVETRQGQERLAEFLAGSQIVLVERGGPLFERVVELRRDYPSLVVTAISPFGLTGPAADAPASDLVLQAAGGIAWMSGRISDAPLRLPFDQAAMVGGIYAATVTAIALFDAEATGNGHLIDVSVQECIAHSLQNAIQVWDLEQRISIRGGVGTRDASEDIFPCKDGLVFLASPLSLGGSWPALVGWMNELGHSSGVALSQERWSSREWRLTAEARTTFREIFTAFTADRTKAELTEAAIARRIVMGPVNKIGDLFTDEQLRHSGFFQTLSNGLTFPGAPYRLSSPVWEARPAPALGADDPLLSSAES